MADGIFAETIEGEMILLDSAGNRYLTLNETGAAIFEAIRNGDTLERIVEGLTRGWEVDSEEARAFALDFLDDLARRGVVRPT